MLIITSINCLENLFIRISMYHRVCNQAVQAHTVCTVVAGSQPASLWKSNSSKLSGKTVKVVLGVWELSSTVADKNVFVSAARKTQIYFIKSLTLNSRNKVFWLHHYGSLEWPKLLLNSLKSCAAKWENAWRIKARFLSLPSSQDEKRQSGFIREYLPPSDVWRAVTLCKFSCQRYRHITPLWYPSQSWPHKKRQRLEYFSPLRCEPLSGGWVLTVRCGSNTSVMSWNQLKGFHNCFLIRASAVGVSHHISVLFRFIKRDPLIVRCNYAKLLVRLVRSHILQDNMKSMTLFCPGEV